MAMLVYQTDIYIYIFILFKLIQYNITTFNRNDIHNKPFVKTNNFPYEFVIPSECRKSA